MLKIAYSGTSKPTALKIAEQLSDVELIRGSDAEVDVNWGRAEARSKLNSDTSTVTNKRTMCELFRDNGVPAPRLWTEADIRQCLADQRSGCPNTWIGRPDRHTKGRGIWRITNLSSLEQALRGTNKKQAATHFMEYIDFDKAPREYRVHVFMGRSVRISEKSFDEEHNYTTSKPQHEVGHVRKAAKAAVKAVGLDFGAVDVLASDTECWVLEVNSAPGLGGSMPKLYAELFAKWKDGTLWT